MRTTIDSAGRLVVPKILRDRVGMRQGEVEISVDGAAIRVESVATDDLIEEHGLLLLPDTDRPIDPDELREIRLGAQR